MVTSLKDVEISHKTRYFFASSMIRQGDKVLDACCGVGYGSMLMSELTHAELIDAFDISKEAINIARYYFNNDNIDFIDKGFEELESEYQYDVITCFEAIEHVEDYEGLFKKLVSMLKPNGKLIVSTPNERRMPWNKERFPEHLRHFTPEQMFHMFESNGIKNIIPYSQEKFSPCLTLGDRGQFVIFVGVKS